MSVFHSFRDASAARTPHQPLAWKRLASGLAEAPLGLSSTQVAPQKLAVTGSCLPRPGLASRGHRGRCAKVVAFKAEAPLVKVNEAPLVRPGTVRYRFIVPQYVTSFGQSLRVIGSLPELGNWEPHLAPSMNWNDGHQWSLDCMLPQKSFEFKIIVFEGHGIRWEDNSNRVVHADDQEGDVPVEIVVWLTCQFNATDSTQLQLAVPRASIQDAYETGKATLEFLKLRKSKLGHDTEQAPSLEARQRQARELARLSEAVVEQSNTVDQLSGMLLGHEGPQGRARGSDSASEASMSNGASISSGAEDEDQVLLLAIDSVRVPRVLRRISFVQSRSEGPAMLATSANGTNGADSPSPFLRGELESRAEDLMSAAEEMLQERNTSVDDSSAASEWASLAAEADHVAVALEALNAAATTTTGTTTTAATDTTQLQMRGLASVGSAIAGAAATTGTTSTISVDGPKRTEVDGAVKPVDEVFEVFSASAVELVEGVIVGSQAPGAGAMDGSFGFAQAAPLDAGLAAGAVVPVSNPDDVADISYGAASSSGNGTSPLAASESSTSYASEVPGHRLPEAHPLQRLAASVKDDPIHTSAALPAHDVGAPTGEEPSLAALEPQGNGEAARAGPTPVHTEQAEQAPAAPSEPLKGPLGSTAEATAKPRSFSWLALLDSIFL